MRPSAGSSPRIAFQRIAFLGRDLVRRICLGNSDVIGGFGRHLVHFFIDFPLRFHDFARRFFAGFGYLLLCFLAGAGNVALIIGDVAEEIGDAKAARLVLAQPAIRSRLAAQL